MGHARLLVVDGEPDLVELARLDLELAGYEVAVTVEAERALQELRREVPDLLLLDLLLPHGGGRRVLHALQEDPRLAELPVVVLTGSDDEDARIRRLLIGTVRCLTKPFSADAVLRSVEEALVPVTAEVRADRRLQRRRLLDRLDGRRASPTGRA